MEYFFYLIYWLLMFCFKGTVATKYIGQNVVRTVYDYVSLDEFKGTQEWNFFVWLFLQKPKPYGPKGL